MHQPQEYFETPVKDICSWVFDNPNYDFDKPLYVDALEPSKTISYQQAKSYVRKLIGGFQNRGLRPGDTVCLNTFNSVYYSLIWLAVVGAGGRFFGANPAYKRYELEHLLSVTKTKFIITEPSLLGAIYPAAQSCGIEDSNILRFDDNEPNPLSVFDSWTELLEHGEQDWQRFNSLTESKNTVAVLAQTSGTTGLPKAAELSHYSFVTYSIQFKYSRVKPYEARPLITLPTFHNFAAPITHLFPLKWGIETYILKRYNFKSFIETIQEHDITEVAVAPPIVNEILRNPEVSQRALQALRFIYWGGTGMRNERLDTLRELCHPEATVGSVWGMTELGWITHSDYWEKNSNNSVGRLLPGNEAKFEDLWPDSLGTDANLKYRIVDEEGYEFYEPGAYGEILIRGPGLMLGYLCNAEATKHQIQNGWLHTGDVGYQRDGLWYIVDRAKDIIKVRGWQVSPTELEQGLCEHNKIKDAAVIGVVLDEAQGELPKAYVVLDKETSLKEREIHDFIGRRFSSYKSLAAGVEFVDAIPRNASGKILKAKLREQMPPTDDLATHDSIDNRTIGKVYGMAYCLSRIMSIILPLYVHTYKLVKDTLSRILSKG